ncbi:MAG TPA: bifunctional diguanylate cyclase/phosphodiesterase [Steroidobacteraceae bacterium]|nr:bifunctional diguanylate cyclase/phosphodiesterase [Steroidobacteraceae bacterium]
MPSTVSERLQEARNRVLSLVAAVRHYRARVRSLECELDEALHRDRLTGLASRLLFMERLREAIERVRAGRQKMFAVLFLDFDRFKVVNDAMGHQAGDQLLVQMAGRLRESLRVDGATAASGNQIARFGGDEFLMLLNDVACTEDAVRIAERLLDGLSRPCRIDGREVSTPASIGIVSSEQGFEDAATVVRNADLAMYEAKRAGRARAVLFSDVMHTRLARHLTIESSLREALGTDQLSLVYQPIVDLNTGRRSSVEALARWNHPVLGAISPAEFVPIAEESGLIVSLGEWVMRESCAALARWQRADPGGAPEVVSVNVSRAELAQGPRLLALVRKTLAFAGLPPQSLQLEVTEREVMRDPAASLALMHELRAIGVRLAMDDFGTGTSSLGCLREYPFDVIKVDRSFIQGLAEGPDQLAVIHATITLIENLGKTSVGEGVETPEQLAILQSLGCHYAQGHFLGSPVAEADLVQTERTLTVPRLRLSG